MNAVAALPHAIADVQGAVVDRLVPLFIDSAGGDAALARAMVLDQIDAYGLVSSADLLRVGRIIGLRMTAVGNLRLSMDMDQNTQACWRSAATLSKEADRLAKFRAERRGARQNAAQPAD
jgi:hypothetical protein